jgi:DNA-binding transcriptional ArsR family regulator
MTGYDKQAKLFKALMHPARLAILDVLRDSEQCVCHLEYLLGYRQAYISQQLSVLRENGLVQDRRDGLNIYYSTAKADIYALIDQAAHMTWQSGLSRQFINIAPPRDSKIVHLSQVQPGRRSSPRLR